MVYVWQLSSGILQTHLHQHVSTCHSLATTVRPRRHCHRILARHRPRHLPVIPPRRRFSSLCRSEGRRTRARQDANPRADQPAERKGHLRAGRRGRREAGRGAGPASSGGVWPGGFVMNDGSTLLIPIPIETDLAAGSTTPGSASSPATRTRSTRHPRTCSLVSDLHSYERGRRFVDKDRRPRRCSLSCSLQRHLSGVYVPVFPRNV